eukprot:CAMPEP_0206265910 /NCGR_PEP_ID=MMETSP0047_2-20121206/30275_1 /ASSEMBLY_ACC=CAM_ASM_000192 /TAXON_ID=195065 /ORGANISM="Chroomonas mesostigmatica_cf, Strain CCMP1168" /LENGTH=52 /DNA_ID=CAMNT_0053693893 /DNA_START=272 /DNA_END=427 /DNA_ORIENTATION=+
MSDTARCRRLDYAVNVPTQRFCPGQTLPLTWTLPSTLSPASRQLAVVGLVPQ